MLSSIHRPEYKAFIQLLAKVREKKGITQVQIANEIGKNQSHVQKTFTLGRRMDACEAFLFMKAMQMTADEWMKLVEQAHTMKSKKG